MGIFLAGCLSPEESQPAEPLEIMEYIVEEKPDAVISVGIWDNGKEEKYVYDAGGKQEYEEYQYQIGSITKTFTGAMLAGEEQLGRIELSAGNPALERLVTHRSGLGEQWEKALSENPEIAFTRDELMQIAGKEASGGDNEFCYSNLGSAVAGTIAADVYAEEHGISDSTYQNCMNYFLKNELALENSEVGTCGDFDCNWEWKSGDEMMAAGAITSNISDLLQYGKLYLSGNEAYAYLRNAIEPIAEVDEDYDIGYFWLIDKNTGIIWHNGEVAMDGENGEEEGYQSFIGISPESNRVVVILSNVILNDEDDTAYVDMLGYLLMQEQ